jgi:hypothetical protein
MNTLIVAPLSASVPPTVVAPLHKGPEADDVGPVITGVEVIAVTVNGLLGELKQLPEIRAVAVI